MCECIQADLVHVYKYLLIHIKNTHMQVHSVETKHFTVYGDLLSCWNEEVAKHLILASPWQLAGYPQLSTGVTPLTLSISLLWNASEERRSFTELWCLPSSAEQTCDCPRLQNDAVELLLQQVSPLALASCGALQHFPANFCKEVLLIFSVIWVFWAPGFDE